MVYNFGLLSPARSPTWARFCANISASYPLTVLGRNWRCRNTCRSASTSFATTPNPAAFEQAFRDARPTWGIERIMLLRGFGAETHALAPSEYDYGSVHVSFRLGRCGQDRSDGGRHGGAGRYSRRLASIHPVLAHRHAGPIANGVVNGFTLISESP